MTEAAEQNLGTVGTVSESLSQGVAVAKVTANLPQTVFGMSAKVSVEVDEDATVLIAYLAAKIGGPVPAEVSAFLIGALKSST